MNPLSVDDIRQLLDSPELLESLSEDDFEFFLEQAQNLVSQTWTWQPQPFQAKALAVFASADETLIASSAGAGKSWLLCNYAITQAMSFPGNTILVVRKVWPNLERTVLRDLKMILSEKLASGEVHYNSHSKAFTFPNSSVIQLAGVQNMDEAAKLQGMNVGLLLVDEATELQEECIEFLYGRLRAVTPEIRPHVVAMTNPIGESWESYWRPRYYKPTKEDWDEPLAPAIGTVWQPKPKEKNPNPPTRCLLHATFRDNPALMANDPNYESKILAIRNEQTRAALLGDLDAALAVQGALWDQEDIDDNRGNVDEADIVKVVVGVDPSIGGKDETGIVVVGLSRDQRAVVLEDCSLVGQPVEWANVVIDAATRYDASYVIAEVNQGGQLVADVLHSVDADVVVKTVRAYQNKIVRAEPIAALTDQAKIVFQADAPKLYRQMCSYVGTGNSPDRLDAFVYAVCDLLNVGSKKKGKMSIGSVQNIETPVSDSSSLINWIR